MGTVCPLPQVCGGPGGGGVTHAALDPFTAFAQGEALLRGQLTALSRDHLITIVKAYQLDVKAPHEAVSEAMLVEAIVAAVPAGTGARDLPRARGLSMPS